jgi:hypothetical protein
MLEALSLAQFTPLVGQTFTAQAAEGSLELRLTEATALRPSGVGRNEPFSLIFVSTGDVWLTQGTYALEHAALPGLTLFLVPVGPGQYQAIFN